MKDRFVEDFTRVRMQLEEVWKKSSPDNQSPLLLDAGGRCIVCRPWQDRVNASFGQSLDSEQAQQGMYYWLSTHETVVHSPQQRIPKQYQELLIDPQPELIRGALTYQDPDKFAGITDFSKAFFLLNRHRLGVIQSAEMTPDTQEARGELRVLGGNARAISLRGCNAGYGGEGPSGTLYVLRLAGFPDYNLMSKDSFGPQTQLEQLVRTQSSFRISRATN